MAYITSYAKAAGLALSLGALTGQQPSITTNAAGKVVVYWPPDKLPAARQWAETTLNAPGGDLSVDFFPLIQPWLLKKYGLYAMGALVLAYIAGRAS